MVKVGNTWVLCALRQRGRVPPFLRGTGRLGHRRVRRCSRAPPATRARERRASGAHPGDPAPIGRILRAVVDSTARRAHRHPRLRRAPGRRRHAHRRRSPALPSRSPAHPPSGDGRLVDARRRGRSRRQRRHRRGPPLLDLDYPEDSRAEVDINVVMTDEGHFVEVQATAEGPAFERLMMDSNSSISARPAPEQLNDIQRASLRSSASSSSHCSGVLTQVRAADDVHVAVRLALHRIAAEVAEQPEPAGGFLAHAPDLPRPRPSRWRLTSDSSPCIRCSRGTASNITVQPVAEHDDIVVLEQDCAGFVVRDDSAEHTVERHSRQYMRGRRFVPEHCFRTCVRAAYTGTRTGTSSCRNMATYCSERRGSISILTGR